MDFSCKFEDDFNFLVNFYKGISFIIWKSLGQLPNLTKVWNPQEICQHKRRPRGASYKHKILKKFEKYWYLGCAGDNEKLNGVGQKYSHACEYILSNTFYQCLHANTKMQKHLKKSEQTLAIKFLAFSIVRILFVNYSFLKWLYRF